jgi:hypothetical protein
VLIRADAPQEGDEPPLVAGWPPATVLDLRAVTEKVEAHPLAPVANVRHIDVLAEAELTGAAGRENLGGLREMYRMMISPEVAPAVVDVVTQLATAPTPVLVHCSAGKDRTGVAIALALRLVGVPRAAVIADYTETGRHMPGVLARMMGGGASLGDTPLASVPREVLDAPASAIEAVLDAWDAHAGGAEGWFVQHGGTPATVEALRARLLA